MIKAVLKELVPPFAVRLYRHASRKYGFFGPYASWEEASRLTSGYDAGEIVERVKAAVLKVKHGEAVYERDSVLFDEIQHSFPVLAGLLRCAAENGNRLSVLDFGGSLGSSYFQCRGFLSVLSSLRWSVVEQAHFAECGQALVADDVLAFYADVDTCVAQETPQVLLASGVIQYLPDPEAWLGEVCGRGFQYLILDITAVWNSERPPGVMVQRVPPHIYTASYPAWILSMERLKAIVAPHYEILAEFDGFESEALAIHGARLRGMIARKR